MSQTRKDNRLAMWSIAVIAVFGAAAFGVYHRMGTTGAIGVIGLGLIILAGVLVRYTSFYACPICKRSLQLSPSENRTSLAIRHHCTRCDVRWDSGIEIGGSGDL